jgi:deoxyadenosine/deoxycytidine kinase
MSILLIILIILSSLFVYYMLVLLIDINILSTLTDEYLVNLNNIPRQIFDYSIEDFNILINKLNSLRNLYEDRLEVFNNLENLNKNYIKIIENNNETIIHLRAEIDRLKSEIANTNGLFYNLNNGK